MSNNLLTELVCTRLSHDIVGGIGAVANAVELLEEGDMDYIEDITAILKTSSNTLSSRVKFFRMAFGLNNAGLDDENTVKQTAEDYLKTLGNKDFPILLEWHSVQPAHRKQALMMIMLAADILIRGGSLKVYEKDKMSIVEIAENVKLATDKLAKIEQCLANGLITPDAALAPLAALVFEGKLSVVRTQENILFTLE